MARRKKIDREARKALAAAAMIFAPATEVPRERVLIRSAIVSLLMAFGQDVFGQDQAIKEISQHGALPELREKIAARLFKQLISQDIIKQVDGRKQPAYQFDVDFVKKTHEQQKEIDQLIEAVIDKLFEIDKLPAHIKPKLRRTLILVLARLMEKYGTQYACQVIGKVDRAPIVQREDLIDICNATMSSDVSGYIDTEIMVEAVMQLFIERDSHFTDFVFALTQQYYYMRLLGLEGGLNILSEDRFGNSKLS